MKLRIPGNFITTNGSGESDYAIHPGSYHMALHDADICDYNIITYSSVIPATSKLISLDEIDMPPFGTELPTIMASANGFFGEHISAGIIWAWLYKDEEMTEKLGGLVCELSGYMSTETLEERLYNVHNDLYKRTYNKYILGEQNIIMNSLTVKKRFGTVLTALCFIN